MDEWCKAANVAEEAGADWNDSIRAAWVAVNKSWHRPDSKRPYVRKKEKVPKSDKPVGKSESVETFTAKIVKVDAEQRMVYGWASVITEKGVPVVDGQGDIIEPDVLEKAATDFMLESRLGLEMHARDDGGKINPEDQVAIIVHSFPLTDELMKAIDVTSEREGWIVGVKVLDDGVWERVKDQSLGSFSIGGVGYREPAEEAA